MDLVSVHPIFNLYNQRWPIRTATAPLPPAKFVRGRHRAGLVVGAGHDHLRGDRPSLGDQLRTCGSRPAPRCRTRVVLPGVRVGRGAVVRGAILDKNVVVARRRAGRRGPRDGPGRATPSARAGSSSWARAPRRCRARTVRTDLTAAAARRRGEQHRTRADRPPRTCRAVSRSAKVARVDRRRVDDGRAVRASCEHHDAAGPQQPHRLVEVARVVGRLRVDEDQVVAPSLSRGSTSSAHPVDQPQPGRTVPGRGERTAGGPLALGVDVDGGEHAVRGHAPSSQRPLTPAPVPISTTARAQIVAARKRRPAPASGPTGAQPSSRRRRRARRRARRPRPRYPSTCSRSARADRLAAGRGWPS